MLNDGLSLADLIDALLCSPLNAEVLIVIAAAVPHRGRAAATGVSVDVDAAI
jgi:hypothetical protein